MDTEAKPADVTETQAAVKRLRARNAELVAALRDILNINENFGVDAAKHMQEIARAAYAAHADDLKRIEFWK